MLPTKVSSLHSLTPFTSTGQLNLSDQEANRAENIVCSAFESLSDDMVNKGSVMKRLLLPWLLWLSFFSLICDCECFCMWTWTREKRNKNESP